MRSLRCFAFLACLAGAVIAGQQPEAQAPPPRADDKGTVEGRVLSAATGAPLKKVFLLLHSTQGQEPSYNATTDAAGRFSFKDIDPGQYRLSASRTGYAHQEYGSRGAGRPGVTLTVAAGERLGNLVFRLNAQCAIAGMVVDEDGEPVMDAQVTASRYGFFEKKRQLYEAATTETNDLGEFRLHGLAPGRYYVSASPRSEGRFSWGLSAVRIGDGKPQQDYAPTYYPGTVMASSASQLSVSPGSEVRGIQIALQRVTTVRIRGRVSNPMSNHPERDTFLMLLPRGTTSLGDIRSARVLDAQGKFEFTGVTPGSYSVVAQWRGDQTGYQGSRNVNVDVAGGNVDDVLVEISAGVDITGFLRVEGRADVDFSDLRVGLAPLESDAWGGRSAPVGNDGSFVLKGVAAGRHRVRLMGAPRDCYLKSVRVGSEEVVESGFEVAGGEQGRIEVLLSPNGGQVEGAVLNDRQRPVRGAQVVLVPEPRLRERTELYRAVSTDLSGKFSLFGVPPGDYRLFAWEEAEESAWEDSEFLKPYEELGKAVRIGEGGRATVELRLIPAAEPEKPPAVVTPARPRPKGATR